MRQVFHVCTSPVVQAAWAKGQPLAVVGMIYDLKDGLVSSLVGPISNDEHLSSHHGDNNFLRHGQSYMCPK
jgi:carbonic anhydrase